MNKTKVFYGNQFVGKITVDGKREGFKKESLIENFNRKSLQFLRLITLALVIYGAYKSGATIESRYGTPRVEAQVIVKEVTSTSTPPVLQRIINCESQGKQYGKNGQVNVHVNTDGTIDLGAMQINSVNFAEATKLGYDLTKESDNIAYGKFLYANRGTEPWYSSKACWNK